MKKLIPRHVLRKMIPVADSTIYEWEKNGDFPSRIQLGPRCVMWDQDEVEAWIEQRKQIPAAPEKASNLTKSFRRQGLRRQALAS
ncbi:helix-turn-helix transcriptional regulator [Oceanimonas smirnovii]|uniref:helix-turn-helix transcriptional regulator n=1 Tax=Oceanimonas smirnovii TaxID=264574 RepID=UPI0003A133F3|nr:AlpA family phage regulatory protein [Oceanimonas smirnovii]